MLHTLSAKQNVVNLSPNLMNFLSVIQCLLNFFVSHSPFLTHTLAVCFCSGTTGMACSRFLAHKLHQFYNFFHCLSCFLLHGDIIVAIFKERIASLKFPCKKMRKNLNINSKVVGRKFVIWLYVGVGVCMLYRLYSACI